MDLITVVPSRIQPPGAKTRCRQRRPPHPRCQVPTPATFITPFNHDRATATNLLLRRVWYRTRARIRRTYSGGVSPAASTTHSSPVTSLPLEVVEAIIAYLAYDARSLLTCTLVCYSWYIAAVPHLYNTIPIGACSCFRSSKWPNPLPRMHTLGLLPLVNALVVNGPYDNDLAFSPKMLSRHTLRQFRALTNVQELWIDYLDIPKFMPRAQRYFGHFLPTLQSLGLGEPRGSNRQIIYFIGLFQHLQTFKLSNPMADIDGESADDLTLTPLFVPPLRRWLVMRSVTEMGLLRDMIDLFGGIRFRYMDLLDVHGMRLLLGACAETLETLILYPSDPYGEKHCSNCVHALTNDRSYSHIFPSGL